MGLYSIIMHIWPIIPGPGKPLLPIQATPGKYSGVKPNTFVMDNNLFIILDQVGVFTFAISGARLALAKKLDPFGALVLAGVTAIGGGSLRDVLLNRPVFWLTDTTTLITILGGFIFTLVLRKRIVTIKRPLFIFDTIGLGVFVVTGLTIALEANLGPVQAILLGTISAVSGGVIRDTLSNEIPLIFRKEMYATACIIGGIFYLSAGYFVTTGWIVWIATMLVVITFRVLSIKSGFSYPSLGG